MSTMTFRNFRQCVSTLLLTVASLPLAVQADSWGRPELEVAIAADGSARVEMTPGPVWPRQPADIPARDALPRVRVERRFGDRWDTLWDGRLVNEVAPLTLVLAPGGHRLVTLDEWGQSGYGEHAIVIYDDHGEVVHAWSLEALLTPAHYETLPRSVSSLWWRGEPWISADGQRVGIPVYVPEAYSLPGRSRILPGSRMIDLELDLATGQPLHRNSPAWTSARATIGVALIQQRAAQAARGRWFTFPLVAPGVGSVDGWDDYLREAYFRLDPHWHRDSARVVVLEPRRPDARVTGLAELRGAIGSTRDVLAVGSPDPDLLRDALVAYFSGIRPGGLPGLRVYVAIDATRAVDVAAALAGKGATFHRIDLGMAIAQRPERLYEWSRRRNENASVSRAPAVR